jgi:sugar phosphate isomerase/epimerase
VRVFVAASTRCFAEMDVWQALHQITELEFDKVELWLDEEGTLKPSEVAARPDDFIGRLREQTRLSPVALTLAHDVEPEVFAGLCGLGKSLRITQLVVPSSPLGTPFNSEIDRLKELHAVATPCGIRVGIKTEAGQLTEDPHTAVELCQAVEGLGLAFDPSYFLGGKDNESVLELVAPYTYHVHLRDSTPEQVQVQVGLGDIDYSRLISQLQRQRYDRALSVEILPALMETEQRPLELRKLRMLLESLL